MVITEFFKASFTGKLSSFQSESGTFFSFHHPLPCVEKGRFYVIEWNKEKKSVRLIPIIMPLGEVTR